MSVRSKAYASRSAFLSDIVRLAILAEGTPLGEHLGTLIAATASETAPSEWKHAFEVVDGILASAAADPLLPLAADDFEVSVFKAAAVLNALASSWSRGHPLETEAVHLRAGWAAARAGFVRLARDGVDYVAHVDHVHLETDRDPRAVIHAIGRDARSRAALAAWPKLTARWVTDDGIRLMVEPWPPELDRTLYQTRCMLPAARAAPRGELRDSTPLPMQCRYVDGASPALELRLTSPESTILVGAASASSAWLDVCGDAFRLLIPLPELAVEGEVSDVCIASGIVSSSFLRVSRPLEVALPATTADDLITEAALRYKTLLTTKPDALDDAIMRKHFKSGDHS